jgi:gamma-glutamyltranspeptidase/glutathione hydrolase
MSGRRRSKGFVAAVVAIAAVLVLEAPRPSPSGASAPRVARGRAIAIASAAREASEAGLETFDRGGNVVDAATAVTFAISVARPQSTGLGGGGFFLVRDAASGEVEAFDARETAPAKALPGTYRSADESRDGSRAVAVPGLVRGALDLHARRGRLPLARVLEPAIRLARRGIRTSEGLARACRERRAVLERDPEAARLFLPGGRPLEPGALFRQEDLARTLEQIAARGRLAFEEGSIPLAIERATSGFVSRADVAAYSPKHREPIRGSYRGREVVTFPLPSSGGVLLLEMLHMLELAPEGESKGARAHFLVEVERRAYRDRTAFLGDADFAPVPWRGLLTSGYARARAATIDPARATDSRTLAPGPVVPRESDHTTHFTVVDSVGNAVASTQTINGLLGAAIVAPGTGIVLNNEMDDFTTRPGEPNLYGLVQGDANAVAPGKRPLSSMTPTFVIEGHELEIALGSPGGSRIITAVLGTLLASIDGGLAPERAVAAPRIHHQWMPDEVWLEPGFSPDIARELEARGHRVRDVGPGTDVQAVFRDPRTGELTAVSDPRGEGRPAAR